MKRLISILITLALITSMLICVPASAEGTSVEVFNLNFDDGKTLASYIYGGESFQAAYTDKTGWQSVKDDIGGRFGDKAMCLSAKTMGNTATGLKIPAASSLKDVGGGTIVVSWDMYADELVGASEFQNLFYLVKKHKTDGTYESQTLKFAYTETGMNLFYVNNDTQRYESLSSYRPANKTWNRYDLVLYYGTAKVELYQNGQCILSKDSSSKVLKGDYVITGIGDTKPVVNFSIRSKDATNPKKAYYDNVRLRVYSSEEAFYPDYAENFQSAEKNTFPSSVYCQTQSAVDFDVESGVYGKAATDKSVKIVKKSDATTGTKDVFYQYTNTVTSYKYGGTVHIGFKLAFDQVGRTFNKYLALKHSSSSTENKNGEKVLKLGFGKLTCKNQSVSVNWEAEKWYKFDVYVTPGNGSDVKNKITVYMNGKEMFKNVEMDEYSFNRIVPMKIGQQEIAKGYNNVMYFDDCTIEYTPAGVEPKYPNVVISSNNDNIRVIDNDTIMIYGSATAADIKEAISVSEGSAHVLSAPYTLADDAANATDCYLYVRTANNYKYMYPIVDRIDRYSEDFSDHTYSSGNEIRDWSALSTPSGKIAGTKTGATGIMGKATNDQSYKNVAGYVGHEYKYTDLPLSIDGKFTVEFSLLMGDEKASENMAFGVMYKNSEGEIKDAGLVNLLYLSSNLIKAGTTNNSDRRVGKYENDRWVKYAVEIDSKTFTATVYMNGEKGSKENFEILPKGTDVTGCEIVSIYRFKYEHSSSNTEADAYSAIDDFKVYLGKYNASADALKCTSSEYDLKGDWIAITEDTDVDTFEDNISLSNKKRFTIYDDETLTSTEMAGENEIVGHNQYLVVETPGGALHYYRIVDQNEKPVILSKVIYKGINENSLTEVTPEDELSLDTYRVRVYYEKYNKEPETAYVALRSNLFDTPEVMEGVSFAEKTLNFGSGYVDSDTIQIEDADAQLKTMVWDTNLSPLCEASVTPLEKKNQ